MLENYIVHIKNTISLMLKIYYKITITKNI